MKLLIYTIIYNLNLSLFSLAVLLLFNCKDQLSSLVFLANLKNVMG